MPFVPDWSWELDGWIVAAGVLCAVAASLLGNFLILRKMSMLGDAISHAVLPGLAAAFLLSESRSSVPMFLGAVLVGVLTALFTEWIRRIGHVDEGASMGVVFTSLFALGLVMIVQAADHVDLDPGCVLYGAIELTPLETVSLGTWEVPRAVVTLGAVAVLNTAFVIAFFKELKISSFDPALASSIGVHAGLMHYLLMVLVAVTAVASFESVGNILVVAMFVVPAAAAYMLTDRLLVMIGLSVILAAISAVAGHVAALTVPAWFGYQSTTTAGMMAVASGAILFLAVAFGPRHGVLVKMARQRLLAWQILVDDIIALLYRMEERGAAARSPLPASASGPANAVPASGELERLPRHGHSPPPPPTLDTLSDVLLADRRSISAALFWLRWQGDAERSAQSYGLTSQGRLRAKRLVRSHRLWEQYLSVEAGVEPDRIHALAETFEHFTDPSLREQLDSAMGTPTKDPHGRPIPQEGDGNR